MQCCGMTKSVSYAEGALKRQGWSHRCCDKRKQKIRMKLLFQKGTSLDLNNFSETRHAKIMRQASFLCIVFSYMYFQSLKSDIEKKKKRNSFTPADNTNVSYLNFYCLLLLLISFSYSRDLLPGML